MLPQVSLLPLSMTCTPLMLLQHIQQISLTSIKTSLAWPDRFFSHGAYRLENFLPRRLFPIDKRRGRKSGLTTRDYIKTPVVTLKRFCSLNNN